MTELPARQVKDRIPNTWPLFFRRHGHFTSIQHQAIPPILEGRDVLVVAATATGKTEAVVAPLLERYWPSLRQPALTILYICPTRALVHDLYARLQPSLEGAGISIAMKTGDTGPLREQRPAILLTTPESTDSLLTRMPRLFISLQALVLDEIHLFDNTPRGDQLRCLLPRIERIRQYTRPGAMPAQRAALSATVPDPAGVAERYLNQGVIVQVRGGRQLVAAVRPLYDLAELGAALAERAGRERHKSLVFCNSRQEVEQTAAYLRQHLPYEAEVFVHYSNLDAAMRREVESRFAGAAVAICVCTSTLELGIDIGTVDDVVLLGAPPDLTSFLQRIGRGARRTGQTQVLCMPRSPGEWARFDALQHLARRGSGSQVAAGEPPLDGVEDVEQYAFRPSVLVQQIFSLTKQSPTGSIRLADVRRLAPTEVGSAGIRRIVSQLSWEGYLQTGRPGEWKPAAKLQELIDRHDIYSNIGADVLGGIAVDAYTGAVIGQTNRPYEKGAVVLFGGRPMTVVWRDRYRFGLAPADQVEADEILRFQQRQASIPFAVAQTVARLLGLQRGQIPSLPVAGDEGEGLWLFHFWGTVWGELLATLIIENGFPAEFVNEYCCYLPRGVTQLPPWNEPLVAKVAKRIATRLAGRLEMGRFHQLLPAEVAITAVIRQLDLERFGRVYRMATVIPATGFAAQLEMLTS